MQSVLSKWRLRHVRSLARQAERAAVSRSFRDSDPLRVLYGTTALILGLLLLPPPGAASGWQPLLARAVALLVAGFVGHLLLRVVAPPARAGNDAWLLVLTLVVLAMAGARAASWLGAGRIESLLGGRLAAYAAPHAFAPLLAGLLFGGPMALAVGLTAGLALSIGADMHPGVFLLSLCATSVAARETPFLRTRSHILRVLARIALWQTPVLLVMALLSEVPVSLEVLGLRALVLAASLVASATAAVWLLPLAERVTRHASNITLNRFADLGQPLLQRLALEAPGTYHHSLMVANLAQSAADRIGANGLLARVGAYYHDIGKLSRPQFFIENQAYELSPHDELPPNISRMIIVNHVKEGLCLARLARLPWPVERMIGEHHGTSVIRWFHHKAQTQARAAATPDEADEVAVEESHYRYHGPTPGDREGSIVSLADAVEAASRAPGRVTPARLESLVAEIVKHKWLDGQLDRSPLSNAELAVVRKSFVFTLTHLLHARLGYPGHEPHPHPKPATAPAPAPGGAAAGG